MKKITLLAFSFLVGCAHAPTPVAPVWAPAIRDPAQGLIWEPNEYERSTAEQIGRQLAYERLGLTAREIHKMSVRFTGTFEGNNPIVRVEFYDPDPHPSASPAEPADSEAEMPVRFTVLVETTNWNVVDHYAPPE